MNGVRTQPPSWLELQATKTKAPITLQVGSGGGDDADHDHAAGHLHGRVEQRAAGGLRLHRQGDVLPAGGQDQPQGPVRVLPVYSAV